MVLSLPIEATLPSQRSPLAVSRPSSLCGTDLLQPGEVLSESFEIRGLLGEGGMGQVYEAWDRLLSRCVAIKVPWPHKHVSLRNEAQALAALRHPNVVGVYGMGRHHALEYIVMECIRGESLEARLERTRAQGKLMKLTEAVDILVRVTDGLAAVHGAGMAHRDIKPANILLAPDSRVVLTDFGIFKPESAEPADSELMGSLAYMAPETILASIGLGEVHLVDCYALGVVAFEMICGSLPFVHESALQLTRMHLDARVPDVLERRPETPARLATIVRQLLAKDPKARPQSMEEVGWQLRHLAPEGRLEVVIAEDNEATAVILAALVTDAAPDAHVQIASDGRTALDLVRRSVPDLVVVDLHLPQLDGIGVCTALRTMGAANRCTVVATSGHARPHEIETLQRQGFTRFLSKGYELAVLMPGLVEEARRRSRRSVPPCAS